MNRKTEIPIETASSVQRYSIQDDLSNSQKRIGEPAIKHNTPNDMHQFTKPVGILLQQMTNVSMPLEAAHQIIIQLNSLTTNRFNFLYDARLFENDCFQLRNCLRFIIRTLSQQVLQFHQLTNQQNHQDHQPNNIQHEQQQQVINNIRRSIDNTLSIYNFLAKCWLRSDVCKGQPYSKEINEEVSSAAGIVIKIGELHQPSKHMLRICLNRLINVMSSSMYESSNPNELKMNIADHKAFWAKNAKYMKDPTMTELMMWNLDTLKVGGKYFMEDLIPNLSITPELLAKLRFRRMGDVRILECYSTMRKNTGFDKKLVFQSIISCYVQNQASLFIPFHDFIQWLDQGVFGEFLSYIWYKLNTHPANYPDMGRQIALVQYLVQISFGEKLVSWLDDGAIDDMFKWVAERKLPLRAITPLLIELLLDKQKFGGLWLLIRDKIVNKYLDIIQLANQSKVYSENAIGYIMKL